MNALPKPPVDTLSDHFCFGCNGSGRDCVLLEEFPLKRCEKDGDFAICGQLRKMCSKHRHEHLYHASKIE